MRSCTITKFVLGLAFLAGSSLFATPCTSGTLASYIALNPTGCTVGLFTFQNFSFAVTSSSGGPVLLTSSKIGTVGEVGSVDVNAQTGELLTSQSLIDVLTANATRLVGHNAEAPTPPAA